MQGGPGDMLLYLGNRNLSSWSMRAWLALVEKGVSFGERVVDLENPHRGGVLATLSPQQRVPVLVHGGLCIHDSLAIMEYAEEAFPGPRLMPAGPVGRAQVRSLLGWMHSGLSALRQGMTFRSTFHATRPPPPAEALAEARQVMSAWEDALAHSGGPYLFGALTLADLTFAPVVARLRADDVSFGEFSRSAPWAARLMERESVQRWLEDAVKLKPASGD